MNPPLEATPMNLRSRPLLSRLRRRLAIACAFAVLVAPAATATAASLTWVESGDAGQTLSTAQITIGSPAIDTLASITGTISSASDHDLYLIQITNGATFSATTKVAAGTLDDTQLFLFNSAGIGVYGNDDDATAAGALAARSTLPAGGSTKPITPGLYYLLIDSSLSYPTSSAGLIFPNFTLTSVPSVDSTSVVGPIGVGGASPLSGYTGTANSFGTYQINLTGATFATTPEPMSFVMFGMGIAGALTFSRFRRGNRAGSSRVGANA